MIQEVERLQRHSSDSSVKKLDAGSSFGTNTESCQIANSDSPISYFCWDIEYEERFWEIFGVIPIGG